jgi:splicing factor 3B subunit 3
VANAKGSGRGGGGTEEEVVTIRGGRYLELSRLRLQEEGEGEAGARLEPVLRQDTFSALRSICKIRPVGASKVRPADIVVAVASPFLFLTLPSIHIHSQDYLVVGSDSGRLSLLELVHYGSNEQQGGYYRLRCVAWLPLGPSGCRRGVPGEYVAADPKGRAVFTGKSHLEYRYPLPSYDILIFHLLERTHSASVDGHKAAAAVVRDPETGRLELRPAHGFAKATGAFIISNSSQGLL